MGSGSTVGTLPRITRPVLPSRVIQSPSCTVTSPTVKRRRPSSITSSPAPATQHLPIPRATTAACDVIPPRPVRIPCAATIP